jgi:hypothetical protein
MTARSIWIVVLVAIISALPSRVVYGQTKNKRPIRAEMQQFHRESVTSEYHAIPRSVRQVSPAYRTSVNGVTITQVNVDDNGMNIVGDAANEPSLAVNPKNPGRMAIAWRQFDTITNNFRQAGYAYTTDGGNTWTFPGVLEPGIFRSDPVLGADADGRFFYNSLTSDIHNNFLCAVFMSTDGGATWGDKTDAHGGDKQWMAIDKTTGAGRGNIYAFWTQVFSSCLPGSFTRGFLTGQYFEDCTDIPDDPYWGTLAINRNGDLYIGGFGDTSFVVVKSSTAQVPFATFGWEMATHVSLDGTISYGTDPNPGGLAGQTSIAVDTSTGPNQGNVYLLCSVQRASTSDPLDVMFSRSTDGGGTWSGAYRINDDTSVTAWQWFGTMSVAPTGRIDVVWLDTRDNPGTVLSSLYYSASYDGGVTWSKNARISDAFDPHLGWPNQNKMGDYFHLISDSTGARLAWAATFNGGEDVYYSWIPDSIAANRTPKITFNKNWNLISVSRDAGAGTVETLFPSATSRAFVYQGSVYAPQDTLSTGAGYWLKFGSAGIQPVPGLRISDLDLSVHTGWNMIGSVSDPVPVGTITSEPPGMVTSQFFGYDNRYITTPTIEPGQGYWIRVNQDGVLHLSSSTSVVAKLASSRIHIIETPERPPSPPVESMAGTGTPTEYALGGAYPNPFNPATTIRYQLPVDSKVRLRIYTMIGQVVATLYDGNQPAGFHSATWNAGSFVSGVYLYKLEAVSVTDPGRSFTSVRKVVFVK